MANSSRPDSGVTSDASELVAGGMFHPFIASAITAKPRARLHRVEHKYNAMHSATDGILTQKTIRFGRDFDLQPSKKEKLGTLSLEAENTTLLLVRGKCYIVYHNDGEEKSKTFKGKRILKYAKHGFQGNVTQLEKLVASGRRKYLVTKPNTLRQSIKHGLKPNLFVTKEMHLRVGKIEVKS